MQPLAGMTDETHPRIGSPMQPDDEPELLEVERNRAIAVAIRALANLVRLRHIEAAVLLERASYMVDPDSLNVDGTVH